MRVCFDIECNSLKDVTQIWLIVCKNYDTGLVDVFRNVTSNPAEKERFLNYARLVDVWIGHNILGYDLLVLEELLGYKPSLDWPAVCDTLILSKLIDYPREGHSIESYGEEFNFPKGSFSKWSDESLFVETSPLYLQLEEYCKRDVEIAALVYTKYLKYTSKEEHTRSLVLEHRFQLVVNSISSNGFSFNKNKAIKLLTDVVLTLDTLDKDILREFPKKLSLIREVTPKETKHGTLSKVDFRWHPTGDLTEFNGGPFCLCEWKSFNPASHSQVVRVLGHSGWSPVEKTQTHIETERELQRLKYQKNRPEPLDTRIKELILKLENMKVSGWKISENNLETLPDVDNLILWKDKCRIKIKKDVSDILKNIIKRTLKRKEHTLSDTTIKIQELLETSSSKEIMELLRTTLTACLPNKTDVAKFVESESPLWSIIVTSMDMYVDCSATFVTDIWVGMRDLQTLPNSISKLQAARTLAKRILYEARRRTLTEWINLCEDDGRIHGKFQGIGAWTHRMAHQAPNTANIPNEFDTQGVKKLLGKELRSLWQAPRNRLLVGVDAEGIQLRIFAHLIDDKEFTDALVRGKKSDESDPHSFNRRLLGHVCKSRQAAKRFIYALLLGAGLPKLAAILECSEQEAKEALARLMERYTGWQRLKDEVFPADAGRGYLVGLDGRRVRIPGDTVGNRKHLCMSGYLQSGEAIVMKSAAIDAAAEIKDNRVQLVNLVHDEYVIEVPNDVYYAEQIKSIYCEAIRKQGIKFNLKCPLEGSGGVGLTWLEIH